MVVQEAGWKVALFWGDRLSRWSVGLFFLFAAVPKIFDVHGFAKIIEAYAFLPDILIMPVAVILPIIEILLAIGLLCNSWKSKLGCAILLTLFIVLLSYSLWIGLDIDCGCFGPEDPEFSAFHGLRTALVRDILMFLPLAYSFWYHKYRTMTFLYGERK